MGSLNNFFVLLFLSIVAIGFATKMNVVYQWKYLDYVWKSRHAKVKALRSGKYNFRSPILVDVDRSQDGRTFVTVAKTKGVPASLCVVSKKKGKGGNLLKPYPSWHWYKEEECTSIINVYKITIDSCNRLWIIDNGMIDDRQVCPVKLMTFDLNTNKLIFEIPIHENFSKNSKTHKGLLMTPIVQTEGKFCEKEKVFITDVEGNGLFILNYPYNWRLDLPSNFKFNSIFNGEPNLESPRGTSPLLKDRFGLALSPKIGKNQQYLLLRPFASNSLYAINVNNTMEKNWGFPLHLHDCDNILRSASTAQAFSSQSTLFFGLTKQPAIGCLNLYRNFESKNIDIVDKDYKTLQFISGMKVIPPSESNYEEELWISTNVYQQVTYKRMDLKKTNFRVLKQSVRKLVEGTKCEVPIGIK